VATHPRGLERPGLLDDGRSLLVRPARPEDLDRLLAFFGRLSRCTISYRMLGPVVPMGAAATRRLVDADHDGRLVLLALLGDAVIGVAEYSRLPERPDRAEVAFTVEDAFQGLGLGGLLLEHIAAAARERGVAVLEADVLAENAPMLRAFRGSGYRVEFGPPASVQHVDLAVDPRTQVIARSDRREHLSTRSSLHPLFAPAAVAVIGANRQRRGVGNAILRNLLDGGYAGGLYAVNPHAGHIESVPCFPSLAEVPGPVDLAVIAVPADAVPAVLEQCAAKGVGAAVVVSADGQRPDGAAARSTERRLARYARTHGMRLVGPNCMGLLRLQPGVRLVATFSPTVPGRGRVSMASHSGPLGLAVLDHARRLGLGFCDFVSLGDSADLSSNDLLQWWEADAATGVVLLHLERFGNPRKFARLARRVAARKPVIAVAPGPARGPDPRPPDGPARPSDSDAAMSALFAQAGVIRARTMQEMFDTALLLASQPVPRGTRVAVLTNAGGPGTLTAAACRAAGLTLAEPAASANPVDLTPMATAADYASAMAALLADDAVDAVIVLFVPPLVQDAAAVAAAVVEAAARYPKKTVASSFLSIDGLSDLLRRDGCTIPSYLYPESAAAALGHAAAYGVWREQAAGVVREPEGIDAERARKLVERHGPGRPDPAATAELLACYGLRLADPDADAITGNAPSAHAQHVTVGVVTDPTFGPVVAFGLAGDYAELLGDLAFRITPISDRDAQEMVRSVRAYDLLAGRRGRPPVDLDAVVDAVLRVSAMVESLPELAQLDIRRIRVGPPGAGAVLLDAALLLADPVAARVPIEPTVTA
jgi:acyl-CoA synthetase (NDP forming)/GNAT superfamily N-acetyltransferase